MIAVLLACLALAPQDETVVLSGARVIPVPGKSIDAGVIVIRNGRIAAVGSKVDVPEGAEVIKLPASSVVVAGFVDMHSHLGSEFEVEEGTESVTPHVRAVEAFTTRHPDVRRALSSGVTTVALAPGNGNLVGGLVGVIKLNGERYDRALYRDAVAVKVSLGAEALRRDREPTSMTGAVRMLRRLLGDEKSDLRRLPVMVHVETMAQIESAEELREEFGHPDMILLHSYETARRKGLLCTIALGPLTVSDPPSRLEAPARLERDGKFIVFVSDAPKSDESQLRVTAALAVRSGLSRKAALEALTVYPAGLLNLRDRVGAIEPGLDADIVVYSGDPLSLASRVERVIVNGKTVYGRKKP